MPVRADGYGEWGYAAGVSGTPDLLAGSRVVLITCVPGAGGGTLVINGGQSIPVPPGIPFTIEPRGQLVDPTLVFTNTLSYFVEVLQ